MLLGFDILHGRGQAVLDMGKGMLYFDEMSISLNGDPTEGSPHISRIKLARNITIPPNSVVKVPGQLDFKLPDYVIEPINNVKLIIPRVLRSGKTEPIMCLINISDTKRTYSKGMEIGRAYAIDGVLDSGENEELDEIPNVRQVKPQEEDSSPEVPLHLLQVFNDSKLNLNDRECKQLADLLIEYQNVFSSDEFDLGHIKNMEHVIETGDAKPIRQRMRRTPVCFVGEEEAHLEKMLKAGVIQASTSDWAAAPVLIRKRDKSVRWCIDYRALNDVTTKDVFPLPLIDDCLDTLVGSQFFSKLDANSAYWQVPVREEDRKKTAFITKYGLFEHVRMGFGLCGAPATYARIMNLVFRGLTWKTVLAFLDDIVVLGSNFAEHLQNLEAAMIRFRDYGLKLKPKKCIFFQREIEFLGRRVSGGSLGMSQKDIQTVLGWPKPTSAKEVERFMGLANYHRVFVKNFSEISTPLYAVTSKLAFEWGETQNTAFETLKRALTTPPILALPNLTDDFILDTDASDHAIGAELLQIQDGKEKVIAYGSYGLTPEQRRYCTTRKELLAVVRFTRQFRHYLLGKPFVVRTDHSSLRWLTNFREPQGQLARWLEELSQYNMVLMHRPGRVHLNADALSRIPGSGDGQCTAWKPRSPLCKLPCGGCKYCQKVNDNWEAFTADVDDVVPLAGNSLGTRPFVFDHTAGREKSMPGTSEVEFIHGALTEFPVNLNYVGEVLIMNGEMGRVEEADIFDIGLKPSEDEPWDNNIDDVLSVQEVINCIPWELAETTRVANVNIVTTRRGMDKAPGATNTVPSSLTSPGGQAKSPDPKEPCSWGYTLSELKLSQSSDLDLIIILDWLQDIKDPDQATLFRGSLALKSYWLNREMFILIDGVLYRNDADSEEKKLVLPVCMQEKALTLNHNLPSAGHQGSSRTRERLKEKYYWYGMKRDVENHVRGCETCNQNKKSDRQGRCPMTEFQAGAPMERVHIDFLGPLPKTSRGNEHVLMMVDQFTKWVECIPVPNQSAELTARTAVDHFFSRFGMPFQVFSDQGRNFDSNLFSELCKVLEIHKTRTTPYRPSSNGQVERYNRTLMDAVRCFIGKSKNKWDLYLQQIAGALRSSVNRMTGYTANKLMLGREVNTPANLMFPQKGGELDTDSYVTNLTSNLQKAHETARSTLQTRSKRMKRDYDLRLLERTYEVGGIVYVLDTATLKGKAKKLSPPWKGPGIIVEKLSAYLYRVKVRNAVFVINHDRVKPCKDLVIPGWIKHWKKTPGSNLSARGEDRVYCSCRKQWQGRFMIQCDYCREWYHGSCVDVTATDALRINRYKCAECIDRSGLF